MPTQMAVHFGLVAVDLVVSDAGAGRPPAVAKLVLALNAAYTWTNRSWALRLPNTEALLLVLVFHELYALAAQDISAVEGVNP